jgi:DNA-binding LytR/AlgR family response regulator
MQVEFQIDSEQKAPKIIVVADKMTDEIADLIRKLSEEEPQMMIGFYDDKLTILEPLKIIRIYTTNGKVYAVTEQGEYSVRLRLYELEERLDSRLFVRISNSEIINLKKVKDFDLNFAGTICVSLIDGTVTYASRRYVTKIKQVLGL